MILASLVTALFMFTGKFAAYLLTGSAAILSDALESVVHLAATGMAGFAFWYSQQPASKDHPYGHGKIAYFSAGVEGAFILVAAFAIFGTAIRDLILGPEIEELGIGLLITGVLALINLALGLTLLAVGRKHRSIVLIANGEHVLTDFWTSLGVVVGVAIVWLTNWVWLDPLVAILVGMQIVLTAISLLRRAFNGLMDRADAEITRVIQNTLDACVREGLLTAYHQLRHRETNTAIWIEVHLLMTGSQTVAQAHRAATEVENRIRHALPGEEIWVTSHLEPDDHRQAHPEGHPGLTDPFA